MDADTDRCKSAFQLDSSQKRLRFPPEPKQVIRPVFRSHAKTTLLFLLLVGAHTLGRVKKDRSGFGKESTKYTENGPGTPGGTSWTIEWLKFDNSYFQATPLAPACLPCCVYLHGRWMAHA